VYFHAANVTRSMKIKFFTTGGTIDKVYFDSKSEFQVGPPQVLDLIKEANVIFEFEIESILRKDSLDMTDGDRQLVRQRIENESCPLIIVTHGTDTMVETARALSGIAKKIIVLTGSMQPARFRTTDAAFNIGSAIGAVQSLPPGVYIVMNGYVLDPWRVRKNRDQNRFEVDG
jgi:L-asparaginase